MAVALTEGATVIDFAGPWEVFQDVHVHDRGATMDEMMPFRLFTVGDSTKPIMGSGGLQLVPDYTFENAPQAKVIVVGAQRGGDALLAWLRKASEKADITMSVCTGAFHLAKAGMLSGKAATTHHDFTDRAGQDVSRRGRQARRALRRIEPSNRHRGRTVLRRGPRPARRRAVLRTSCR